MSRRQNEAPGGLPGLRWICTLVLTTTMVSCGPTHDRDEEPAVSLIQLIATPKAYHEKMVTVAGVLSLRFEDRALYFSEADHSRSLAMNSIWLDLEPEQSEIYQSLEGQYVVIEGRFDAENRGHLNLWSGSIGEVRWIRQLPTVEEFRQQQMPNE